jgi:hypothetical protein
MAPAPTPATLHLLPVWPRAHPLCLRTAWHPPTLSIRSVWSCQTQRAQWWVTLDHSGVSNTGHSSSTPLTLLTTPGDLQRGCTCDVIFTLRCVGTPHTLLLLIALLLSLYLPQEFQNPCYARAVGVELESGQYMYYRGRCSAECDAKCNFVVRSDTISKVWELQTRHHQFADQQFSIALTSASGLHCLHCCFCCPLA